MKNNKQESRTTANSVVFPVIETTGDRVIAFLFKWVFPIYRHELLKVLPVILMMLSALFVYTTYRDIKDGMIFNVPAAHGTREFDFGRGPRVAGRQPYARSQPSLRRQSLILPDTKEFEPARGPAVVSQRRDIGT